jgi:hypothetical protein
MVVVPSASARVEDAREFDRVEGPLVLVIDRQPLFVAALCDGPNHRARLWIAEAAGLAVGWGQCAEAEGGVPTVPVPG